MGTEIIGNKYPKGWKLISHAYYDGDHRLQGDTLQGRGIKAFALQEIKTDVSQSPRRSVIVGAVRISTDQQKRGQFFTKECKHSKRSPAEGQVILAEVRFKPCERYSSRVIAAWLIDLNAKTIGSVPTEGIRCVDYTFGNGEGDVCPDVPKEW